MSEMDRVRRLAIYDVPLIAAVTMAGVVIVAWTDSSPWVFPVGILSYCACEFAYRLWAHRKDSP